MFSANSSFRNLECSSKHRPIKGAVFYFDSCFKSDTCKIYLNLREEGKDGDKLAVLFDFYIKVTRF